MAKTGVIFDCDGTLLDSMDSWRGVDNELARRAGIEFTHEENRIIASMTLEESADYIHRTHHLGSCDQDVLDLIDEIMTEYFVDRAQALPGAISFVAALKQAGVAVCVASNSPQRYLQAGLARAGLLGFFETVLSVENIGRGKRHPDIFFEAARQMNTTPQTTWGIDDAAYALASLRHAGFGTVGIKDSGGGDSLEALGHEADLVITGFHQLDVEYFMHR